MSTSRLVNQQRGGQHALAGLAVGLMSIAQKRLNIRSWWGFPVSRHRITSQQAGKKADGMIVDVTFPMQRPGSPERGFVTYKAGKVVQSASQAD